MASSTNAHSIQKLVAPARTNDTISLSTMLLGEELRQVQQVQQVQGECGGTMECGRLYAPNVNTRFLPIPSE